jgi:hypothetical protein
MIERRQGTRAYVVAGILALLTVVTLLAVGTWAYRSVNGAAPETGTVSSHPVPLGAFLGADHHGVDRVDGFAAWLGAPVTVGRTYLPGTSWENIQGPAWALDPWSAWRSARPGRVLVLNVPMAAPNEPPVGDEEAASLLRSGADGRYDAHFRTLAHRLVDRRANDTIIVLGWEMNGTTYSGRCAPDAAAWKGYWRRIVAVMRSVPGQRFRFDFTPVRGRQAIPWTECYPGDDVVDIVGMDSYDQEPGRTFRDFVTQPYGLQAQADFAAAHGKPMSYPEWGLYDYGDDAAYICAMHSWLTTHDVAYQSITDYCPHGVWGCAANPDSARAYRQLFGLKGGCPPNPQ